MVSWSFGSQMGVRMASNADFSDPDFWSEAWIKHIETYLKAPARCGVWLNTILGDKSLTVHECAGGSCRDSRYLFNLGYKASGSDFDEKTLAYVRNRFASSAFAIQREDAFRLSYGNSNFDVVFHNGFWVCFDDDRALLELLREQVRVTRRLAIGLVHNAANASNVKIFREKSEHDGLYKIRFFDREKLKQILEESKINYRSYRFEKFGGPVDRLYALERKFPVLSAPIRWLVPRLYRFQPWSRVERIALIVDLGTSPV